MRIRATFLDEISHDIPHQNWGRNEWDADFGHMKAIGIDTVVLIRCGHQRWLTYPSEVLVSRESAHLPPIDLVRMFLELSLKHEMQFYFGLYDSGRYRFDGDHVAETDINRHVIDEAWATYGGHPAFGGWYITQEFSRRSAGIVDLCFQLGRHCKDVSGGLPVMISPYIDGAKSVDQFSAAIRRADAITPEVHAREWDEILGGIRDAVDIVAFQDGHVDFAELEEFLSVNKALADAHGMKSWTNCESFDRDMPIKFLPIKWEKLLLKLEAAARVGIAEAITFEFSHFMSPQSAYLQAGHLYDRYREYLAGSGGRQRPPTRMPRRSLDRSASSSAPPARSGTTSSR